MSSEDYAGIVLRAATLSFTGFDKALAFWASS